jgi:Undecaprenyl-phosphate galactose phosphotransferase WbaP
MGQSRRWAEATALAATDTAATCLAAAAAYTASAALAAALGDPGFVSPSDALATRAGPFAAVVALLVASLAAKGHYHWRTPFWTEARQVAQACLVALFAEGFLHYAGKGYMSRLITVQTWAFAPVAILSLRVLAKSLMWRAGYGRARVAVFGEPEAAGRAAAMLSADRSLGYETVWVSDPADHGAALSILSEVDASLAVVAMSDAGRPSDNALATALGAAGVPLAIVPSTGGMAVSGMRAQYVMGLDTVLLVDRGNLAPGLARAGKRAFDVTVAATLLLVAAVPVAVLAAATASDGGSPLFAHRRVGAGGREFPCLKLRTMRRDSKAVLKRLLDTDPAAAAEWDRDRKLRNDPRVTRLGAFLRKTALDELPQLLNVLKGDMSLVGPRPVTDEEMERYGASAGLYRSVRPGLTGLWQVSGRSDLTYDQRVTLDTWYVRNWSVWHDVAILAKTVPAILARRGAY